MTAVDLGPGEVLPWDEQPKRILHLCGSELAAEAAYGLVQEHAVAGELLVRSERAAMDQGGKQGRDASCEDP